MKDDGITNENMGMETDPAKKTKGQIPEESPSIVLYVIIALAGVAILAILAFMFFCAGGTEEAEEDEAKTSTDEDSPEDSPEDEDKGESLNM